MKIGLDFDGTYTRDPKLWDGFIRLAKAQGHEVAIVTMRALDCPEEIIKLPGIDVVYTNRQPKALFYPADVWIDDHPHWIFGARA